MQTQIFVLLKLSIISNDMEFIICHVDTIREGELLDTDHVRGKEEEDEEDSKEWDIYQWAESYAASYSNDGCSISGGKYFFDSGIAVSVERVEELDERTYSILNQYI